MRSLIACPSIIIIVNHETTVSPMGQGYLRKIGITRHTQRILNIDFKMQALQRIGIQGDIITTYVEREIKMVSATMGYELTGCRQPLNVP